jgi:hypothetical protein
MSHAKPLHNRRFVKRRRAERQVDHAVLWVAEREGKNRASSVAAYLRPPSSDQAIFGCTNLSSK